MGSAARTRQIFGDGVVGCLSSVGVSTTLNFGL